MDHSRFDDEQTLDLYLMGRLDPEREEELEAHLLGCAHCRDELELRRRFVDGLRSAGATAFGVAPSAFEARAERWRMLALAATVLLGISTLISAWSVREASLLRESQPAAAQDGMPVVVMTLEQVRGAAPAASGVLVSGPTPRLYVLQIDADWQARQAYEAVLRPEAGEPLLRERLVPDHRGMLVLALPSTRLHRGEFSLEIRAVDDAAAPLRFQLRVEEPAGREG